MLPAYLRYLLHEHELTVMPWHVARQLSVRDARFERRTGMLTTTQREVIRAVLVQLATLAHVAEVMTPASAAWSVPSV